MNAQIESPIRRIAASFHSSGGDVTTGDNGNTVGGECSVDDGAFQQSMSSQRGFILNPSA